MTDPIAAAGAVASAGAKAAVDLLKEDESEQQALIRLGADSPSLLAAAEVRAQRTLVRQAVLLKMWQNVGRLVGLSDDYFRTTFAEDLAERTQHIPPEDLVEPKPFVAAPAAQGLAYSLDEPDLKNMYLNLLAKASDGRTSGPHPAFVEVIKQLSPREAQLLPKILAGERIPVAQVTAQSPGSQGYSEMATHLVSPEIVRTTFSGPGFLPPPVRAELLSQVEWTLFVDNWVRLALVTVSYDAWLTAPGAYDWADSHPELLGWKSLLQHASSLHPSSDPPKVVSFSKGTMDLTQFGRDFLLVVTSSSVASAVTAPADGVGLA